MEVTIKKLNLKASIIKQLQRINFNEIEGATCLGFVINIIKDNYKVHIIQLTNGEYRKLEYNWYGYTNPEIESTKIYKKSGKGTAQIDLGSTDNVANFISFLKNCNEHSQQIYV